MLIKKQKLIKVISINLLFSVFVLFFLVSKPAFASSDDECEDLEDKLEQCEELNEDDDVCEDLEDRLEDCEKYDKKASKYRKLIKLKKKESTSLKNQLQLMDLQIGSVGYEIKKTKQSVDRNKEEIKLLEQETLLKEEGIKERRVQLKEVLKLYYQIYQEFDMEFLSVSGDLATVLNQSEYLEQASYKIEKVINEIKKIKEKINKEKEEYEKKNEELARQKKELQNKVYDLNSKKESKGALLLATKGEEARYKKLLARVEKQKQELINLSSLSVEVKGELDDILKRAKRPPKKAHASTGWYYSQKDKRWANKKIGISSSLMKDYGCAVTSLAMVFTKHDEPISPKSLSSKSIFYRDLIVWPRKWDGLDLISSTAHSGVNWSKVDKEIKRGNPVIVFVRAASGKGHYVVIHSKYKGRYVVHDPLFGPNIYLNTTMKLVSAIYNRKTTVDQMIIYDD